MEQIRDKNRIVDKLDSDGIQLAMKLLDLVIRRIEQHETQSEQRVKLFLTLGSGSIAFLTIFARFGGQPDTINFWTTLVVLFVLLIFGLETMHSLIWQIIYVRSNSKLDSILRATLAKQYQFVSTYNYIIDESENLRSKPTGWRRRIRGSLTEFMYIANSLIVSGIVIMFFWGIGVLYSFIVCGITFIMFTIVQYFYSKWMKNIIPIEWALESHKEFSNIQDDLRSMQ
ncbi:MAG: hypothetical protein HZB59_03740 [Ignavibacteriales bacterium]|nr:hypothetical protein [Ignavibacteriales bacterium]